MHRANPTDGGANERARHRGDDGGDGDRERYGTAQEIADIVARLTRDERVARLHRRGDDERACRDRAPHNDGAMRHGSFQEGEKCPIVAACIAKCRAQADAERQQQAKPGEERAEASRTVSDVIVGVPRKQIIAEHVDPDVRDQRGSDGRKNEQRRQ